MTIQPTETHRIEWTGNIQVHVPIRPATVHATAKAFAVMCA